MGTNIIFLWHRHVQKKTQKNTHTIHKLAPSILHPPEGCTVLALSFLLSNNSLPREKQSVLDLKAKGTCLYHVQLSSRQNSSTQVWREKCCHWGVVPFIHRLSRMEIMGWEDWRDGNGWGAKGMNTFPHPSIPLHSSTNRSQHVFVSALLLPFFPSPLERANTFSLCQHSPLPVCVSLLHQPNFALWTQKGWVSEQQ